MTETTEGTLLGGRVRYRQPATGFRSGIEPVLLAAAIPARAGQHVLEGGTGAGAGLLCLAARVPGLNGLGIDIDPALVELARRNAEINQHDGLHFNAARVDAVTAARKFDHAFANPPYHSGDGTRSPVAERDRAKRGMDGILVAWAESLAGQLRPGGTLTMIARAARLPESLVGLEAARCGSGTLLPLWPRAGAPANLVIVQGVFERRGAFQVGPGLVLHRADGKFTDAAEAVLREGAPLPLRA